MTVIAACLYRNGQKVRDLDISEKIACDADKSEFVWIGMAEPTEAEMQCLKENYHLHPLAVEDALNADQLPKVDIYGDQLFVVARTAHLEGGRIRYGETTLFVGPHHIISVRSGSAPSRRSLRSELEAAPTLLAQGVDYVLHAILDFIVDSYLPVIEAIEEEALAMEQHTADSFLGRSEITRIFTLRRELIRFQRVLLPMSEIAGKLTHTDLPCIDPESRPYFSDVLDHAHRVLTMVDDLRQILASVFEFSNLLEQQRTGAITRQLAAWAAILAVPTAIAGIYGMNFRHMPELGTRYGYYIILGIMAAICALLYVRFRRMKWL